MKITKYVHSCLLVETRNLRALIDPGRYSYESHLLHVPKLEQLDYIIITHVHNDHYHEGFLRVLADHSPGAKIVTNNDLAKEIEKLGLPNAVQVGSDENITVFEAPHEPLPFKMPVPLNIGVHIKDILTHPGDALDIKHSKEILALPVSAPSWTNLKNALEAAATLKPSKVLPIHDWHWHKSAREEVYSKIQDFLKPKDIEFITLENTVPFQLEDRPWEKTGKI